MAPGRNLMQSKMERNYWLGSQSITNLELSSVFLAQGASYVQGVDSWWRSI